MAVTDKTLLPNWTANNPETTNEEQQSSCQPMCLPKQLLQLPSCHNTTRTKLLPAWKPDVILKLLVLPLVYFCHFFRIFSQFLFFLITSFCHVLSLITIQSTFPPPPHNNWWKYNHINNWFIVIILFLVLYPLLIKFPWLSLFLK